MRKLLYISLVLLAVACKDKYESPVVSPSTGYLVVDGVLNSGPGAASIRLTRSTKLNDTATVYETGAAVSLQAQDSSVIALADQGQGVYGASSLVLNSGLQYRLRINTKNGARYLSDFVPVKNNPPIDSISWKVQPDGLQLYINTHDPQNNTRYYQWNYDETWQITSAYYSMLKYKIVRSAGDITYSVVYRDSTRFSADTTIINCWQFNKPLNIFIGSTAKLSQDIVALPLVFIPHASVKLGVLYSIHVKQSAWTKDGYEFLDRMRKNTETTGSIFDPQPSELNTNIHNVANAADPVIGFFNICTLQEKRIFIRAGDIPSWGYSSGCTDVVIENLSDSIKVKGSSLFPTIPEKTGPFGSIITFRAADPNCVDCTLRGTNKKPDYWP